MKKYILSLVMLLICCMTASAQQFKVMKGDKNVKTWTINEVDSIAVDEVKGVEVFKLMLNGKTVATYNRSEADRIEVCKGKMVTSITGVPATLDIFAGNITKLTATVNKDASDQTLTWSSSDESVVMVSQEGHVAAINEGTATVTATANDGSGKSASCKVSVTVFIPVTSVSLNKTTSTLAFGGTDAQKTTTLTATVGPNDATNKNVTWTSDKPGVATVSDAGVVTAVAVGTANITVTTEDGAKTATCAVTVNQLVTSVSLSSSTSELVLGGTDAQKTTTLSATVNPEDATDTSLTWKSSDETVATVANGVVTAVKAGTATITATANDGSGKYAECAVTVKQLITLNIKVTSSDIATLKAIKVVTDQNIDGESKEKVLQVAEAQQKPADDGTVYSIKIPSQEYAFYQIYLSEDCTTYKEAMASKSAVGEITEDQDIDYEKNAIQLWADGPYFATENAGYMKWAKGMTAWGSAWTLPSKTELTNLYDDSYATKSYAQEGSTYGFKFTSKAEGYTGNSIFLPAYDTSGKYGGGAVYWSSTEDGTTNAWRVSLQYSYNDGFESTWKSNGGRNFSNFVRLVLR